MQHLNRIARKSFVVLILALGAIQLVPVDRSNPPVETEVPAPAEVRSVLRQACYDCHSNETLWPWYSRIAPISWLIEHDVHHGREELNLSTWNRMTAKKHGKVLKEIWEEVEEGEMPPWYYLPTHPKARLSKSDRSTLRAWALSGGGQASARP